MNYLELYQEFKAKVGDVICLGYHPNYQRLESVVIAKTMSEDSYFIHGNYRLIRYIGSGEKRKISSMRKEAVSCKISLTEAISFIRMNTVILADGRQLIKCSKIATDIK